MRIAFISDIHANIFALKEVLKDIMNQNVDRIICLGDLVGYATYPNEVINLIREKEILTIQGNYDEAVADDLIVCGCDYKEQKAMENAGRSLMWSQENVNSENKAWLAGLPTEKRLNIEGRNIYLVHGSPRKNNEYLYHDSDAIFEIMEENEFDILVCGHTHLPYFKAIGSRYIINAGSAGKPKHGSPRATYVIVEIKNDYVNYFCREVAYDFEKTATAIEREEGMPDDFAHLFRTGQG